MKWHGLSDALIWVLDTYISGNPLELGVEKTRKESLTEDTKFPTK